MGAALTLLLAYRTGEYHAVFGVVSAGREAPVRGVERMACPTVATVPLHNPVERRVTLDAYLHSLVLSTTTSSLIIF